MVRDLILKKGETFIQGVIRAGNGKIYIIENRPCETCIHNNDDGTCKAFPKGIPQEIRSGYNDHTKEYPGDHGIRYTPPPEA